jgi:hypothetical protein
MTTNRSVPPQESVAQGENQEYRLSLVTPGIEKAHTNFILPEIKLDVEGWGKEGVYFVQDKDGLIKIGLSNKISKRISQYKTHRAGLRLVGVIGCAPRYLTYNENLLHRLWSDFVVTGEWFAPVRPLIRYITAFKSGYGTPLELYTYGKPGEPNTYIELIALEEETRGM